jgi:hypothetical protein
LESDRALCFAEGTHERSEMHVGQVGILVGHYALSTGLKHASHVSACLFGRSATLNDIRAILGNDIAIDAYREGELPYPDGTIIDRLAWS